MKIGLGLHKLARADVDALAEKNEFLAMEMKEKSLNNCQHCALRILKALKVPYPEGLPLAKEAIVRAKWRAFATVAGTYFMF
ncbi:hypothetical protein MTO96_033320 [Rhipicephalus appendiculatus]